MVTPQQQAAAALWQWQELRALTPAERIRVLVERAMLPPLSHDTAYADQIEAVRQEMSRA